MENGCKIIVYLFKMASIEPIAKITKEKLA